MGPNAKELFRLVEDFVDVIGFRMKDLRDAYQVTDNLGKPRPRTADPHPRHAPAVQPWPGARRLPLLVRVHPCARAVAGAHPPGQPPRWVSSFRCIDLKLWASAWASDPDAVPETLNLGVHREPQATASPLAAPPWGQAPTSTCHPRCPPCAGLGDFKAGLCGHPLSVSHSETVWSEGPGLHPAAGVDRVCDTSWWPCSLPGNAGVAHSGTAHTGRAGGQ